MHSLSGFCCCVCVCGGGSNGSRRERVEKGMMGVEKRVIGVEEVVMIGGSNSLLLLVVIVLPRLLFGVAQMCREWVEWDGVGGMV